MYSTKKFLSAEPSSMLLLMFLCLEYFSPWLANSYLSFKGPASLSSPQSVLWPLVNTSAIQVMVDVAVTFPTLHPVRTEHILASLHL